MIGVFDSGFGGLTILKSFLKNLPEYDYVYVGDNARSPYGTRSFQTVYRFTLSGVKALFDSGCHLVILACNTASAKALRTIQQNDLPIIAPEKRVLGVIRPCVEKLISVTHSGSVGILGTSGTVQSESYIMEVAKLNPHIKIYQQACPMWVPIVENGEEDSPGADYFINKDINSLLVKGMTDGNNIDTVVMGCTHYPLLEHKIRKFLPKNINLISQGPIVADSLKDYLQRHPEIEKMCCKNSKRQFFTTETPEHFDRNGSRFLGVEIKAKELRIQ